MRLGIMSALLCLVKLGGDAEMSSGRWKLRPYQYMEEIEDRKVEMFGHRKNCQTLWGLFSHRRGASHWKY